MGGELRLRDFLRIFLPRSGTIPAECPSRLLAREAAALEELAETLARVIGEARRLGLGEPDTVERGEILLHAAQRLSRWLRAAAVALVVPELQDPPARRQIDESRRLAGGIAASAVAFEAYTEAVRCGGTESWVAWMLEKQLHIRKVISKYTSASVSGITHAPHVLRTFRAELRALERAHRKTVRKEGWEGFQRELRENVWRRESDLVYRANRGSILEQSD